MLKKVECIIKPYKLESVREALDRIGVQCMTVTEVKRSGNQKGTIEHYRGVEYTVDFLTRLKVEIVVQKDLVNKVVASIRNTMRNGKVTDEEIFVMPIDEVIRIRTGELSESAI